MPVVTPWWKNLGRLFRSGEGQRSSKGQGNQVERALALQQLSNAYEKTAGDFYEYLPEHLRALFVSDAIYHRKRYMDMLALEMGNHILELGSDKPFISHFVRQVCPDAIVDTVSIDVPFSPYPITRIDIEQDEFPFEAGCFTDVIFTEVLEHLFRDPAWTAYQINKVLAPGGKLFLTTPNACGYDVLVNLLMQAPPNGRNQFYECIESGHPHLWTAAECRLLLESNGFKVLELSTVDYYEVPLANHIAQFLNAASVAPELNGQVLRIVAEKSRDAASPNYPTKLFPSGKPVQMSGALLEWADKCIPSARRSETSLDK